MPSNGHVAVPIGQRDEGALELRDRADQSADVVAQVEAKIGRDLVVAASPGP